MHGSLIQIQSNGRGLWGLTLRQFGQDLPSQGPYSHATPPTLFPGPPFPFPDLSVPCAQSDTLCLPPHGTWPELPRGGATQPEGSLLGSDSCYPRHSPLPPRTLSTSQWHPPRGPGRLSALHHLQPEGTFPGPEPGARGCECCANLPYTSWI